jgi:uncharacterized protein (DUF58 family)
MALTRRTALVALVLAVALFAYPGDVIGSAWITLLILDAALLLVAVADRCLAVPPAQVGIRRTHPPVMVLDSEAELTWSVENESSRTVVVSWADELAPSLHARTRRAALRLPGRGRGTASTRFRPSRRGRFDIAELSVRTRGPLGLALRTQRRRVPTVLRVHPPFRSRDEAELLIRKARILEVGLRSARGLGGGTEFEQLRDYTTDDEFRRVDWAASARVGRPIVRTYRPERNQSVMVLLDNGRLMAGRVADAPRLEHAMDAAIMLTHVATRLGDRVGLVTFDSQPRAIVPPSRGHEQTARVTEAVYALEPAFVESDYRGAFTALMARFRRRSLIVLLSDLVGPAMEESLLPAMPLLVRRHLVIVGAVRDPETAAWASSPLADVDPEATYRKVAAVAALDERQRSAARLRAAGATVVDAAPGRLAGELADTYLRIKSTGRL